MHTLAFTRIHNAMNIADRTRHANVWLLDKLLSTGLCILLAGLLPVSVVVAQTLPSVQTIAPAATISAPATAASVSVPVDQQPLTIRQPIPPNIVLMLDDSGSMAYDYMPDWQYIGHCNGDNYCDPYINELRDAKINGTYYNPDVIYTPPSQADGSSFPNSPGIDDAYIDGFRDRTETVSVTADRNDYDCNYNGCSTPGGNKLPSGMQPPSFDYYKTFTGATIVPYPPVSGCADGSKPINNGTECIINVTYTYRDDNRFFGYTYCRYDNYDLVPADKSLNKYDDNNDNYVCRKISDYDTVPVSSQYPYCNNGGTYNVTSGKCEREEEQYFKLFTYTTDDGNGGYVQHYVGKSQDACSAAPSGSDCDFSAAAQQNVANWFSYYRTRFLMAKSGLMNAFANLDATYRVGFGSINANAKSDLPTNQYAFNNYSGSSTGSSSNALAQIEPFGTGADGSQKSSMWGWLNNEFPSGGTPLRKSLKAVGDYYGTDQPWQKSDTDTSMLACRQSYVILTTDGFWNGANPNVGDVDNEKGDVIKGPNQTDYQYNPIPPFSGGYNTQGLSGNQGQTKNTLADVAMYYWDHDLKSNISNEVPTNDSDNAFWQHMVTFTIGLGFTPQNIAGTFSPLDESEVDQILKWAREGDKYAIPGFSWPKPDGGNENGSGGILNNIADLAHAAVNGHGGFYSATSPESFATGLKDALNRTAERTGSGASLAANSTQLKTGTVAYQAIYHTKQWTGELNAYEVDPVTGKLADHAAWNAAEAMPAAANRNIYTYNPASDKYLAFKDDGSATPRTAPALSADQITALGGDPVAMVDYLRGDDTANGSKWRQRKAILGDIVDSQPVYVGGVSANQFAGRIFTGSDTFATYAADEQSRGGRIYVAANDGMLHAFDATTGAETYAYLPAAVITYGSATGGISEFADPDYGQTDMPHQYFNDGQLTVADAYFDSAWHTVLVGTTGRGAAKAIYALDVTDPDNIKFLWERSAYTSSTACSNCGYIGQMTGKPIVAQVADGEWAVLIGNGYNSAKDQAALLQFSLSDGTLTVHAAGTDTANGLAAPAVWLGDLADNISTVAYAGDLKGHVWSFELSSVTKQTDGTYAATSTPSSAGAKLFTATDSNSKAQPITSGMLVGRNPSTGDLWIFFGTGRYLAADDIKDTSVQSWYGLIVNVNGTDQSLVDNLGTDGRSALAERSIIAQFPGSTVKNADGTTTVTLPARVMTPNDQATSMSGKSGWYIDLETPAMNADGTVSSYTPEGERMITPNQFQGSRLVATSIVPKSTDLCNPSGTGWIMALDPFTGTNPEPQFYDINGDGKVDDNDMVTVNGKSYAAGGVGFNSLPNAPIFVGGAMLTSFDNGTTSSVMTSGAGGSIQRVSWRELVNP